VQLYVSATAPTPALQNGSTSAQLASGWRPAGRLIDHTYLCSVKCLQHSSLLQGRLVWAEVREESIDSLQAGWSSGPASVCAVAEQCLLVALLLVLYTICSRHILHPLTLIANVWCVQECKAYPSRLQPHPRPLGADPVTDKWQLAVSHDGVRHAC
jgi:hypothetical protein